MVLFLLAHLVRLLQLFGVLLFFRPFLRPPFTQLLSVLGLFLWPSPAEFLLIVLL